MYMYMMYMYTCTDVYMYVRHKVCKVCKFSVYQLIYKQKAIYNVQCKHLALT